jgi:hypothetical protein
MKIDGRCHCGYITYEAEIEPEKVMICHCADCQTLSAPHFAQSQNAILVKIFQVRAQQGLFAHFGLSRMPWVKHLR